MSDENSIMLQVSCPHLFIKGTESLKYMSDENYDRLLKVCSSILKFIL